jgi:hypothetical protein
MDDRVRAIGERGEAVRPVERAFDPDDAIAGGLRPAGERADVMTGGERLIEQHAADEPRRAGEG